MILWCRVIQTTFSHYQGLAYQFIMLSIHILDHTLNPFHRFLYPLKTLENCSSVMFAGGIERDHWHEMC